MITKTRGDVRAALRFNAGQPLKVGSLLGAAALMLMPAAALGGAGGGAQFPDDIRTIDGWGNNESNPQWGAAETAFRRLAAPAYADGIGEPSGGKRGNPRAISNACGAQTESILNEKRASDYIWQWGQFLDHDLDETPIAFPFEPFNIAVPLGDPWFDPFFTGTQVIPLNRSVYDMSSGTRQQVNFITAYIDASNVYGSDAARAAELRRFDGMGRLKMSAGRLLPFNVNGFPNAPTPHDSSFFLAGDVRANEQNALTAMHTLFVREHNFWAVVFRILIPWASEEDIYQTARAFVAAEMQAITYNEFLPVLLGPDALEPYQGYDETVDVSIANEFAAAAYRLGHSLLSPELLRLRRNGQPIRAGNISLAEAFFTPQEIIDHGIDPLLRGLAKQQAQEMDGLVIDEVRNFLFGPPGAGGLDLASLNIQRGRDHGLPGYNQVRIELGLDPVTSFADISSNPDTQDRLALAYATVDDVDLWVGGLCEDHHGEAMIGETFFTILKDQFERLRDGDRFWYQSYLPPLFVHLVEQQTLATIIRRNTSIRNELQDNVFLMAE